MKLFTCSLFIFSALHAAPVLSVNFDGLTPQESVTLVGAFHTINGTNVDIIGKNSSNPEINFFAGICGFPESGNCVDLDGTADRHGANPEGAIQAELVLGPSQYDLSFDLIGAGGLAYGRNDATVTTVEFGGAGCHSAATCLFYQVFALAPNDIASGDVSDAAINVTHAGNYFLTFVSDSPGRVGALLDNVSIVSELPDCDPPVGVPEPSAASLGALGFVAMLLMGAAGKKRSIRQ